VKLKRKYLLDAPKGVAGRNSDNTMIKRVLNWEPSIPIREGLKTTYKWIEGQYRDRKAGRKTVKDRL
jgi:nucleoside-diphosphate-sugar epimerase